MTVKVARLLQTIFGAMVNPQSVIDSSQVTLDIGPARYHLTPTTTTKVSSVQHLQENNRLRMESHLCHFISKSDIANLFIYIISPLFTLDIYLSENKRELTVGWTPKEIPYRVEDTAFIGEYNELYHDQLHQNLVPGCGPFNDKQNLVQVFLECCLTAPKSHLVKDALKIRTNMTKWIPKVKPGTAYSTTLHKCMSKVGVGKIYSAIWLNIGEVLFTLNECIQKNRIPILMDNLGIICSYAIHPQSDMCIILIYDEDNGYHVYNVVDVIKENKEIIEGIDKEVRYESELYKFCCFKF